MGCVHDQWDMDCSEGKKVACAHAGEVLGVVFSLVCGWLPPNVARSMLVIVGTGEFEECSVR